jgi:hypothetical protein
MLFVKFNLETGLPIAVTDEFPAECKANWNPAWKNRWDWTTFDRVVELATYITALTGDLHVGTDAGAHVSPRYDIVRAPKVGDEVSYAFNGDCYPDGVITALTKGLQVTTTSGSKYRRKGQTGSWLKTGGTWSLVNGHIYEQNPSF